MTFEGGETVLIKAPNLCSVRDYAADAKGGDGRRAAVGLAQEMVGKFNELMRMCEKIKAQLGLPADITRVADILKATRRWACRRRDARRAGRAHARRGGRG